MNQWKGTKCEPGYIQKQKVFQSLMLLVYIAIGVGLFLLGLWITGTRANVFTVLGILMVLPGAKRVIALVVMLPHQSVERAQYEALKKVVSPQAVILADYVFTSPDKIMSFDFVVVEDKQVTGIAPGKADDIPYMTDYLKKGIAAIAPEFEVRIVVNEAEYLRQYKSHGESPQAEKTEEVVEYLTILAV